MADRSKGDTSRIIKNPLLTAAGSGFPFENFSGSALLMPVSQNETSSLSEDVGEVDSFLGQDPSAATPSLGVGPARSLPDAKPLTFFRGQQASQDLFSHPSAVVSSPRPLDNYTPQPFNPVLRPVPTVSPIPPPQAFPGAGVPSYVPQQGFASSVPLLQPAQIENPHSVSSTPTSSFTSSPSQTPPPTVPLFPSTPGQFQHGRGEIAAPSASTPPIASCAPYSQQLQHLTSAVSSSPIPLPVATVAPLAGTTNTYRLGSQKKLVYAQPPGLSVSSPVLTSYSPATTTPAAAYNPPSYSSSTFVTTPLVATGHGSTMATTVAPAPTLATSGPPQYQTSEPSVLPPSFTNLSQGQPGMMYRPVYHHWFHKKEVETKFLWQPFSMVDSLALEEAFTSTDISPETIVPTDGGRYDVNILRRQRSSVYWEESPTEVRRCSWFYKGAIDSRYVPYEESISTRLEEEFKIATTSNEWHRRVEFPNGESVVFHGPSVMVHFPHASSPDAWGNTPQVPTRPRVVKRGVDEFEIDEGEPANMDHLLFLVHGVGSACDLKFRTVEEVVDDFRSLSLQLVQSHFRTATEQGQVNRIEVLPISWHSTLHGEDTGIDRKLKSITLHSIPKLRHFTNDTLLDILFYTSPVFCQTIMHTVGKEINRLHDLFRSRHPTFQGGVSLGGHSLGSLILFDLLYHQTPPSVDKENTAEKPNSRENSTEPNSLDEDSNQDTVGPIASIKVPPHQQQLSHRVSYVMGNAGTGQPFISYPQLSFHPKAFFALGSPIGMFVTVRGIETLGEDFRLPTCPAFFNIFHPFDPVAYRIETLINSELTSLKPVMIPHHKGRKRMHLELKETMARVGADLKQKLLESVRSTWNTVYQLAMFHRSDGQAVLEQEVDKVLEEQMQQQDSESTHSAEEPDLDVCVGQLNGGRRVDYVLQEAPLESFNEYLFALGSHVCYWESEDTMLMILKEVYGSMGISADSNVPQSNLPTEKPVLPTSTTVNHLYSDTLLFTHPSGMSGVSQFVGGGDNSDTFDAPVGTFPVDLHGSSSMILDSSSITPPVSATNNHPPIGMDPTAPLVENKNLGPPPMLGFVRK